VSEPVVSFAGAMLKRREVGIRYKYYVEPGEVGFFDVLFLLFELWKKRTTRTRMSLEPGSSKRIVCFRLPERAC
jgi:hypothetical protein